MEAELRNSQATVFSELQSHIILYAEAELRNFKSQYIPCAEADFKPKNIPCVEAELQNFKSHNSLCAEAELQVT